MRQKLRNYANMANIVTHIKIIILCLTLVLLSTSCSQNKDFYFVDGQGYQFDDFEGQWLIINFWAEWCAPCREEVGPLNQLFKLSSQENWQVIGVSFDPLPNSEISRITAEWGVQYPIIATDPMPILPVKLPAGLPSNYIFNPQGKLVKKVSGKQDFDSLKKILDELKQSSN